MLFLRSFLGNFSQYLGNCRLNFSLPQGQEEEAGEGAVGKLMGEAEEGKWGGEMGTGVGP